MEEGGAPSFQHVPGRQPVPWSPKIGSKLKNVSHKGRHLEDRESRLSRCRGKTRHRRGEISSVKGPRTPVRPDSYPRLLCSDPTSVCFDVHTLLFLMVGWNPSTRSTTGVDPPHVSCHFRVSVRVHVLNFHRLHEVSVNSRRVRDKGR